MTAVLVLLTGFRLLPPTGAVIAALLTSVAPHQVAITGYLLTETLFAFLLAGAVYLLTLALQERRLVWWASFGVLVGLSALVRPAVLLYPAALMPLLLLGVPNRRFAAKATGLALVGVLLFWMSWSAWKHVHSRAADLAYDPAAAQVALGSYPDLTHRDPKLRGYPYREDEAYRRMQGGLGHAATVIVERAQEAPGRYLEWYLVGKPRTFWSWDIVVGAGGPFIYPVSSSLYHESRLAYRSLVLMKRSHTALVVIGLLTIGGVALRAFRGGLRSPTGVAAGAIALLLVYFTGVHMVMAPLPRYSIPLQGPLYLLAAYGLTEGYRFLRKNRSAVRSRRES
jgi:4-amino-4-deoxy-L-arabinose transferase-like glycosyltransferase